MFGFFISGFTVPEARCRMINHQCSCLEVVLFTSFIHFYVNYQEYISNIKEWKLKIWGQNFDRMKEAWCTRYTQPMLRHVPAVCLQKAVISTYMEMSELEILS